MGSFGFAHFEQTRLKAQKTQKQQIPEKSENFSEMDLHSGNTKVDVSGNDKTLYEQDRKVNGLMKQISSYTNITQSANDYEQIKNREQKAAGLGTMIGVYFPTIQNIFGVILFIRMPWIVGLAGIWGAFGLVAFCCLTTLLTAISMSAIATNGKVPAGGSYYMISRSLGPGWGGAVGMMFYLGTTVASAMYIVGAAEIMTLYIDIGRIWDLNDGEGLFTGELNNYRVWGIIFLTLMTLIVFVGVKYVNMMSMPFLAVVIVSISCLLGGFFGSAAGPNPDTVVCMIGDTLTKRPHDGLCEKFLEDIENFDSFNFYNLTLCDSTTCEPTFDAKYGDTYVAKCARQSTSDDWKKDDCKTPTPLMKSFCSPNFNMATFDPLDPYGNCDEQFKEFLQHPTWNRHGVPGLGFDKASWNSEPHHYNDVLDPINHPEMLDKKTAAQTNNMIKCVNYDFKEFSDRTEYNQTKQWECKDVDSWQELNTAEKNNLIGKITNNTVPNSCPAKGESDVTSGIMAKRPENATINSLPYVASDMVGSNVMSSLMILIGVFFPSVTGIMAGSNRSGDLADGAKSIPKGTVAAILTTATTYLVCVLLSGFACDGALMRDKYGDALTNGNGKKILMNASITLPVPEVMLYGAFLSSIGAGLQSLTGAPRLLQSIANDDVIPKFGIFAKGRGAGNEPTWAVLLTWFISLIFILIAKIESITPFITIFFLMCYLFVNISTTLCSLIQAPSWRPSFKYYHWIASLAGSICCLALIFIVDWISAIIIGVLAGVLYCLIEVFGGKKEWGDSVKGLHMSIAINSLRTLNNNISTHTKNWRPQILLLNKFKENTTELKYPHLLDFCHSLKEGKGLLIIKTLIQGEYEDYADQAENFRAAINKQVQDRKVEAIETGIAISPDIARDVPLLTQSVGLSGLKPNCICINFPTVASDREDYSFFYNTARQSAATDSALIVTKNIENFPASTDIVTGTIDVWWIRLDGGMCLLLSHLLKRTSTWKRCPLRIFVTAEETDNSEAMREQLDEYLKSMRINAQVYIVEMSAEDTLPYAQNISQRLADKRNSRENVKDVDVVMKNARKSCLPSTKPKQYSSDVEQIPTSYSGTWSNNVVGPRATIIKKMHEASGLNKEIQERSKDAALVLMNMPPFPLEHNLERETNYMKYIESITKNLNRLVLVRTTGNEVITAYN